VRGQIDGDCGAVAARDAVERGCGAAGIDPHHGIGAVLGAALECGEAVKIYHVLRLVFSRETSGGS